MTRAKQTETREGARSRRGFLKGAAAGGASLVFGTGFTGWKRSARAIVIGSGFGGAVAALRLAQARIETVVFERGRRWDVTPAGDTFGTMQRPDGRLAWLRDRLVGVGLEGLDIPIDRYTGVLDVVQTPDLNIYQGAGVGGGSLVYGGTSSQPSEQAFRASFPDIDYAEMARLYYPRAKKMLKVGSLPPDILASENYLYARAGYEHFRRAGFEVRTTESAVDYDIVRAELRGEVVPSFITGQASPFGANSGAKNSLDRNYLADAQRTGFCEIRPLTRVQRIERLLGGRYGVTVEQLTTQGEVIGCDVHVCDLLFLAAGSLGTTRLLLDASRRRSLPGLSPWVGSCWGDNGNQLALRVEVGLTGAWAGGPIPYQVGIDEGPLGPATLELSGGANGEETRALAMLGMGISDARGQLSLDRRSGELVLSWPGDVNAGARAAIAAIHTRLNEANSGSFGPIPVPNTRASIYHPLGGAVRGRVVDSYGAVYRNHGLYVVDGASIAGSTAGTNPSLTIAALAERSLDRILDRDL